METRSMPSYWPHSLFMAFYGHFHAVIGLIKFRGRLVIFILHVAIGFPPLYPACVHYLYNDISRCNTIAKWICLNLSFPVRKNTTQKQLQEPNTCCYNACSACVPVLGYFVGNRNS